MIDFQTDNVEMPEFDFRRVTKWIETVAVAHDRIVGNVAYCFCDDEAILAANCQFVNHDYYTDIITFDYTIGRKIGGDILISLDTVRSNAEKFGKSFDNELMRVIIHGILHLCGIDDKGPGEREIMEAHEDEALRMLNWDNVEC